jgi:hypothetical protein
VNTKPNNIIQGRVFVWLALATGLILLIPLIAMQITNKVRWDGTDFLVMGALLLGTGSMFVLVSRKVAHQRRLLVGLLSGAVLFYLWAELAVGVFTNLGS